MKHIKFCIVCHDLNQIDYLAKYCNRLSKIDNISCSTTFYISSKNSIEEIKVRLRGKNYIIYEDKFFDYSAYEIAFSDAEKYDGILVINDTFSSKHKSVFLEHFFHKEFEIHINSITFSKIPFLMGPQSESSFSFQENRIKNYIPTYIFFMNTLISKEIKSIFSDKIIIYNKLKNFNYSTNENDPYIKSLVYYSGSISDRYIDEDTLHRKITACYLEKKLNSLFIELGVVKFIDSNYKRKFFINIEQSIRRKLKF